MPNVWPNSSSTSVLFTKISILSAWRHSSQKEKKVPLRQIHRCHLLDYESQLLSIVLSHCHYSLTIGKGQKISYNLPALEKHIMDRFIHGKPLILSDIPQVVYRRDVYNASTFADIRSKVSPQVKTKISGSCNLYEFVISLRGQLSHICDIWWNWPLLILYQTDFILDFRNYIVLCKPYIS